MSVESPCIAESQPHVSAKRVNDVKHRGGFSPIDESSERDASPVKAARLRPKEHGAYAILAIPLIAALFIVGVAPTVLLVATAAVAAFFAHEPLMIVAGNRGNRVRQSTPAAVRAFAARLAVVVLCGSSAFWLGGINVRLGLLACLVFAAVEFAISANGYHRTLAAQMLGIAGLTLPSAVVLVAGGVELVAAAQFWLIWFAGRMATTVSVRSAITHHKSSASLSALRICDIALAIAFMVCGVGIYWGDAIWIVTLPLLLAAATLRALSPHPRNLKHVGWSLLVVNVVCGIVAIGIWNY